MSDQIKSKSNIVNPYPEKFPELFSSYQKLQSKLVCKYDWLFSSPNSSAVDYSIAACFVLSAIVNGGIVFAFLLPGTQTQYHHDPLLTSAHFAFVLSLIYFTLRHIFTTKILRRNHEALEQFTSTLSTESMNEVIRLLRDFKQRSENACLSKLLSHTNKLSADTYNLALAIVENPTSIAKFNALEFLFSESIEPREWDYFERISQPNHIYTYAGYLLVQADYQQNSLMEIEQQKFKNKLAAL